MRSTLVAGVIAIVVLVGGLLVWFATKRPVTTPVAQVPRASDITVETELGDEVVGRALEQIPGFMDSTAFKSQWVDEIDGVDVAALNESQIEIFVRSANAQRCTCGCGYTLAACRRFDTTCPVSLPIVEALRDSVVDGIITTAEGLRERPKDL